MNICPECACENPDFACYCWRCAAELGAARAQPAPDFPASPPAAGPVPAETGVAPGADEAAPAPDEATVAADEQPTCPECGHAVQPQARFCNNCGAVLRAAETPDPAG
jgi:hypothetical protein